MSRLGKKPITLPEKVEVIIDKGMVTAKGPKGTLSTKLLDGYCVKIENNTVVVKSDSDAEECRAKWGLLRVLINNMVLGVSKGYVKGLIIEGTGFRFALEGNSKLTITAGYSHLIRYIAPQGITFAIEGQNRVTVTGIDKQLVGQVAAEIRKVRKPEPYKGKGIRYDDEVIVRKVGKKSGKK